MNLDELDQLVENYLSYRNFKNSVKALSEERLSSKPSNDVDDRQDVIDRIMKSLEKSDSLRLFTLWDTYVTQTLDHQSPDIILEARVAEFYVHLYCATYPFRSEVLQTVNSPNVAAKYAARSMTIFKRFLELRGKRLLKMPEFSGLKNLHKIAFPPTHPSFSYLFRPEWLTVAKEKISNFLRAFFKPPRLYTDMLAVQNVGRLEAREVEIKRMYEQREDKLLSLSRSIYDISHRLINTLEAGKTVDKDFLHNFKNKFEEFRVVLEPATDGAAGRRRRKKKGRDNKSGRDPLVSDLSYSVIIQDITSMVGEVGVELSSLTTGDRRMTSVDAEVALQSAMQASSLFNALNEYLATEISELGVEEDAAKENRKRTAGVLLDNDIFSLKERPEQAGRPGSYTSTIMSAFCKSFDTLCTHVAARHAPHVSASDKTFSTGDIGSTYGILYSASCATVYNMCKLFSTVVVSATTKAFISRMKDSSSLSCHQFFVGVCEALFSFPIVADGALENIKIVFLILLALLSQDRKHKHTLVKNGFYEWIAKTLDVYSRTAGSVGETFHNDIYMLCVIISSSILENAESQRMLVASVSMQKSCVSVVRLVVRGLVADNDLDESLHIICLRTIYNLFKEKSIREILFQEREELIIPLVARLQSNLSLHPTTEVFQLSNSIIKYSDATMEAEQDGPLSESETDSATLAEAYMHRLLLRLPDEVNTSEYRHQHPRDSGMKLLMNYTKTYISDHGSLYDDTTSLGEF